MTLKSSRENQKPKQCCDNARVDGGDGDEGGRALVEKGRGRDKLEREGDEVEHQKNSSATHAAHAHGDADEEEDNEEGHAADDNVGDVGEGMRRAEVWDAAFHGDAEHPMALYVSRRFSRIPSRDRECSERGEGVECEVVFTNASRGDKRCHSSSGMVIVTAEGQGLEQRKREMKKLSQRQVWCLDARIWYLPKQKYPAQCYYCSLVNYAEPSSPSTGGVEEPTVSIGYTTMPVHLIGAMDEEQADLADALCLPWWWVLEVIPWKYHAQREGDEEWLTGYRLTPPIQDKFWPPPPHTPPAHQPQGPLQRQGAHGGGAPWHVGTVAVPRPKGEGDTGKKGEGRGRCFWLAGGAWSKTTTAMRETASNFFNKTKSTFRNLWKNMWATI
ncbi:hypothetical protein JB92DRAFT_2833523 [Gautieria morchelliformis]|nr:hypothetical protein JB92DRAFT_2833523 [Gautieria morchelliformis]